MTVGSTDIADYQLALDAMRDGVALWSADGRLMVANAAASTLMNIPPGMIRPGLERLEMMIFFARRGDYGPTDDPDALARKLSAGFGQGEVKSLDAQTARRPLRARRRAAARRRPLARHLSRSAPAPPR